MNFENLFLIIAYIAIFVSLLFSIFLATTKSKLQNSNRLFAVFLLLSAIDISGVLPYQVFERTSTLTLLRSHLIFLQLPIFYLYVLSVCYSDFKLHYKHLVHGIPFLIANLLFIPNYFLVEIDERILFLLHRDEQIELQLTLILFHIQSFSYLGWVFYLIQKNKKLYQENFSDTQIQSYRWLFQVTLTLTIFFVFALFKNLAVFTDNESLMQMFRSGLLTLVLINICIYLFKALKYPNLFRNFDSTLQLAEEIIRTKQPEEKKKQLTTEDQKMVDQLQTLLNTEKLYLSPSLTIQQVADQLEIPAKDLSVLINHKLGKHFFDFINGYRIEAAQKILKDPSKKKVTVLEILFEVGFNSKSSFNTAFKKHTGTTPTLFRKSL